jgi:hypothetical protein
MSDKFKYSSDGNRSWREKLFDLGDDFYAPAAVIYNENGDHVHPFIDVDNYLDTYFLDGSTRDMAVDGSTTAVEYAYTVPAGNVLMATMVNIDIEDGTNAFDPEKFGAIGGGLSNGVEISITPSGESKQVIELIKTNRELGTLFYDLVGFFKKDGDYIGRWSLARDVGCKGYYLDEGDKFSVLIQDDLSGMDYLSFKLKGLLYVK